MELRPLGTTGIRVSAVALGCWPIAGMTSGGVNDSDSLATIAACFELGINHLDTAYCYGAEGESENLIRRAIAGRRDEVVIATKGGIHWGTDKHQVFDASPARLRLECEASLQRLGTDRVELYYLHAPDPAVPIAETAGGLRQLLDEGKIRSVGASNCTVEQLEAFIAECPLAAVQPPYNLLQREIEDALVPWCRQRQISLMVYWPLMKGLLAGKLAREHRFPPSDSRSKYPMFHGEEWEKNHDFVDRLRAISAMSGHTVAQLAVNWAIHQPGVTTALCGAKRPDQIRETAAGAGWRMTHEQQALLAEALAERGEAKTRRPV